MANPNVKYTISADDKTKAGIASAKQGLGDLSKGFGLAGQTGVNALTSIAQTMLSPAGLVAGIGLAVKGLVDFGNKARETFLANEQSVIRYTRALQSARIDVQDMNEVVGDLSRLTTTAATDLQSLVGRLVSSGRSAEQTQRILEASISVSNATGQQLDSVVNQLNKTFGGTAGELAELIPAVRGLSREQLQNGEAVEIVAGQYSDFLDSLEGSSTQIMTNLSNAWDGLEETIGESLQQSLNPFLEWLTDVVNEANRSIRVNRSNFDANQAINSGTRPSTLEEAQALLMAIPQRREALERYRGYDNTGSTDALLRSIDRLEQQAITLIRGAAAERQSEPEVQARRQAEEANASFQEFIELARLENQRREILGNDELTQAEQQRQLLRRNLDTQQLSENHLREFVQLFRDNRGTISEPQFLDGLETLTNALYDNSIDIEEAAEKIVKPFEEVALTIEDLKNEFAKQTEQMETSDKLVDKSQPGDQEAPSGIGSALSGMFTAVDPITAIAELILSIKGMKEILDPVNTIFMSFFEIISPLVSEILAPFVGFLRIIGQTLGAVLAPVFKALGAVLQPLIEGLVFLYNKAILPFANGIIWLITQISNFFIDGMNAVIKALNQIPFVDIKRLQRVNQNGELYLDEISTADLYRAGGMEGVGGTEGGTTGAGAQYSGAQTKNFYVTVNTDVITGDNGFQELAIRLRDTLERAEALGY